MDFNNIIQPLYEEMVKSPPAGKVADYIPELAKVDPDKFGIHLHTVDGACIGVGDFEENFSIQSISKVFSLSLVVSQIGEKIWERIGVEPSGNPFNSIVQLEYEKGIPRNPFINAGAMVLADVLIDLYPDPESEFLSYVRMLANNPHIQSNRVIALSEIQTGHVNAALIHMLKYHGNIKNEINRVLSMYYFQCALEMNCRDLSEAFLAFANHQKQFQFGDAALTSSQVKRINAIMQTCGFYDEAGEFSYRVGLPGKSGVGGGIAAIHPGQYAVAVWSPRLNPKGNSALGMKTLELLTTRTGLSIF